MDSFYRNESFFFCSPMDALMTGDVYTRKDLTQEASWVNSKVFTSLSEFAGYRWNLFFGAGHDGDFITPLLGERNEYKDLTVRIMYWNKGVEAVYYIYAEFDTSPYTLEALGGGGTGRHRRDGGRRLHPLPRRHGKHHLPYRVRHQLPALLLGGGGGGRERDPDPAPIPRPAPSGPISRAPPWCG